MRRGLIALFALTHLAVAWVLVVPAPYVVDEAAYDLQARAFSRGEGWAIDNGWEQVRSDELQIIADGPISPHLGRLVVQYPPHLSALAAPLFPALGIRALFLINALFALLAAWATARLARLLVPDPRAPTLAVGVLAVGTFAWPYGVAAWPHMSALGLVTAGLALAVQASQRADRSPWAVLGGGLLIGLACGFRLDAFFLLGGVASGLLLLDSRRLDRPLILVLGAVPGLLLLSAINLDKFGVPSPFFYGRQAGARLERFLPALAGVAGLGLWAAAAWLPERQRGRARAVLVLLGAVGAVALPQGRAALVKVLGGALGMVVDLRELPARPSLGMVRLNSGTMTYHGFVKKALLQSVPALALLPWAVPRSRWRSWRVVTVLGGVLVATFAYSSWHGGPSLNLRYFLPLLPPAAVGISAALCRELPAGSERKSLPAFAAGVLAAASIFALAVAWRLQDTRAVAPWLMNTPLLLALAAAVLGLPRFDAHRRWRRVAWGAAVAWGGLVALGYDLPAERLHRQDLLELGQATAALAPPDAAVFVAHAEAGLGLFQREDLVVGFPTNDAAASLRPTMDALLELERPVLCVFSQPMWEDLSGAGMFAGLELEPAGKVGDYLAVRIRTPPAP